MAFLAAAVFPFTQSEDHNANIGVNILIFATVALGLNIVVGLTGLLDLGYVAFLGVGAYAAALVSGSEYSRFSGTQLPFWEPYSSAWPPHSSSASSSAHPTLRLRGDYLAIVTLGFGEIFRIAVNNLDGSSGPDITNGPNGIANIPDLEILGFNLGEPHVIAGFTLGRFANYFLLMLVFTAIVVLVFTRAADSRIGPLLGRHPRGRDRRHRHGHQRLPRQLVAFALGAALAGLAGTVSAHVSYPSSPPPTSSPAPHRPTPRSCSPRSSSAAWAPVSGPLLGASLLYLIPEKLSFLKNYELLAFGIAPHPPHALPPRRHHRQPPPPTRIPRDRPTRHPRTTEPARRHHRRHQGDQGRGVTTMTNTVLEASGVTMRFGGLTAVRSVDLTVSEGEIVGPHRTQRRRKDHLLQLPHRPLHPHRGARSPTRDPSSRPNPHLVTQAGMARTFQNIRLFANMTVLENVLVGRHTPHQGRPLVRSSCAAPASRSAEAASEERAMELLEFIGLAHKRDHLARSLPYGEQRKLEIARALASEPGPPPPRRADRRA